MTAESLAQEEWPNYFAWYGGEALADIAQIKELCVENGVELVVFVNPEFYVRWDEAVERGYLDFLEQLAQVTDFYSFGGHNSVTCSMENFHDISHYKPQVGDSMIYLLEQGIGENGGRADVDARQTWSDTLGDAERQRIESLRDEGFGQYVTAENIQDYLAKLQGGRQ